MYVIDLLNGEKKYISNEEEILAQKNFYLYCIYTKK